MSAPRDAEVGDCLPSREIGPLSPMDFAWFSAAMNDFNQVHIMESVAKAAGLPTVIGSGGIVQGLMDDVVIAWAGVDSRRSIRNRITRPLLPGTTISVTGTVTGRNGDEVDVAVEATDQDGQTLGEAFCTITPAR